jgi:putative ABC transport system permease protein
LDTSIPFVPSTLFELKHLGRQDKASDVHSLRSEVSVRTLSADLRYAIRLLTKSPGFTLISILTLALGIGANTAIFSVVNAVLLKPLPYPNPDSLISLRGSHSLPDVLDVARESRTLEQLGTFADFDFDMTQGSEPERVEGAIVGGDLLPALGVLPVLGRYFNAEDEAAKRQVVVISHNFWARKLGGRPDVIGKSLQLSGVAYTVLGVMPDGFKLPRGKSQVWVPFSVGYPEAANARGAHFTYPVGRLRPGVTLEQARAEVATIATNLGKLHPADERNIVVMNLHERVAANLRTPVLILLAAVALVLLIACTNYANLLLAKVAGRSHEMSVRTALGATRLRLVRQLVTESTLLSLLGGAGGILLATWAINLLLFIKPENVALFNSVSLDRRALLFAFGVSVLTGLFFGLAPAVPVWSTKADLKSAGGAVTVRSRLRQTLVALELAISIVLLVGAGLLIRSFWQVVKQDPGFSTERVLTMRYSLPAARYQEIPKQQEFIAKVEAAAKEVPGVESAALVTELPLDGSRMRHNMIIKDLPEPKPGEEPEIETHEITPDYLKTIGIRLLSGRVPDANDRANTQLVGVINQTMAHRFWPGENPIGKQVRWAGFEKIDWITVVGVVADSRDQALEEAPDATIYTPMSQKLQPWKRSGAVVVRTHADDPFSVAAAVQQKVWSVDSQLPLTDVETLDTIMAESLGERRFNLTLLVSFAGLALVLAVVGLYGVMSYVATQRTREVGIRVALGATSSDIVREFVWSATGMIVAGAVVGTMGAFIGTRVLSTMLYEVRSTDALTFGTVLLLLTATALLATYIPARRAAKTDPMVALRHE